MLIRTIGEDRLNQRARSYLGTEAFNRITTFAQVRREVYGELHPDAHQLSSAELLRIASVPMGSRRVTAVARALSVKTSDFQVKTMQEAYARYYARRLNTASLSAYGGMLEQLSLASCCRRRPCSACLSTSNTKPTMLTVWKRGFRAPCVSSTRPARSSNALVIWA
jgi:hypothetical protein